MCLIHDNAGAHKCKLVQVYPETETVLQLSNPPYSPDVGPCDVFQFTLLKNSTDVDMSLKDLFMTSAIVHCLQRVPKNVYLSASRAWISILET